jgi:hypothetical protein
MTAETAEKMMDHHVGCGGFEFTRSTVQRDEKSGDRYYAYQCVKCKTEIRESIPVTAAEELPVEKAA